MNKKIREVLELVKDGKIDVVDAEERICEVMSFSNEEGPVPFCHFHNEKMTFDTTSKEYFCYLCEYSD